ncbi:MAG: hypothetical protein LBI27_03535 [Clostridiales bacterium]|jgi:hypothetical protein|nr:hypothetical protein [Clostridiales bacterium]
MEEKFQEMKSNIETLAGDTNVFLIETGEELTNGLLAMQDEFNASIHSMSQSQLANLQAAAAQAQSLLQKVKTSFSAVSSMAAARIGLIGDVNNSRNSSVNIGTIVNQTAQASAQSWYEIDMLQLNGLR